MWGGIMLEIFFFVICRLVDNMLRKYLLADILSTKINVNICFFLLACEK